MYYQRPFIALLILLIPGHLPFIQAADPVLPNGFNLIPRDADLVVSVRVTKLWQSDLCKSYRDMIGPNTESLIDMFGWQPDDLDRLTAFGTGDDFLALLTTVKPTDQKKVRALYTPRGLKVEGRVPCYRNEETWITVAFLDAHTTLIGPADVVESHLRRDQGKVGPHADTLKLASTHDVVVAATNGKSGLNVIYQSLPDPLNKKIPLFKASYAAATLDLVTANKGQEAGPELRGKLIVRCGSKQDADADRLALATLLAAGRKELGRLLETWEKDGLPFAEKLNDGLLAAVKKLQGMEVGKIESPTPDGRELSLDVALRQPKDVGVLALCAAMSGMVRSYYSDGSLPKPDPNLEKLAKAVLAYEKDHGRLPPPAIYARDGKTPLLSWRVLLLPYLGDEAKRLHAEFRLDEPWDSEHNIRLVRKMPKLFALAENDEGLMFATTPFQLFTGPDTLFPGPKGLPLKDATDGAANTILIAQSLRPVPWTKPQDLAYAAGKPVPLLGGSGGSCLSGPVAHVAFADGTVRVFPVPLKSGPGPNVDVQGWSEALDEAALRGRITPVGGEKVSPDAGLRKAGAIVPALSPLVLPRP